MDYNNYKPRTEIQEQLQNIGKEIDSLAQSSMIKEIVYMFVDNIQFNESEQIITFFKHKLNNNDLEEIKEYILETYKYELQIE